MDPEQLIRVTWIRSDELSSCAVSDTASHHGNRNQGREESAVKERDGIVVKEDREEIAVKKEREEIAVKEEREEIAVKEEREEIAVKEEREEIAVKEEREEIAVKNICDESVVKEEQRSISRGTAAGLSSDSLGVQLTICPQLSVLQAIPLTSCSTNPTKKRRSWSGLPIAGSGPVLPDLCIICQKKEKLINRAGKRQRDPLSKAETLTAGQLQKAAELKDDQSILIHIKDKDCVSLEVQYHKGCYNQYTRFLTRPEKPKKEQNKPMFDVSYKIFCERIIRQRLLVNKEVLRMGQLRKTFIELVKANEGLDALNYSQDMLKKRLTRDFPQLVFHIPTKRNICELVVAETLSTNALVDMPPYPSGAETTQSSELRKTDSETEKGNTHEDARTLHTAGLFLKRHLSDTPAMSCPRPPTSENVNVTEAQNVVPLALYNLVSCIIGATDEPTLDHYVNIDDDLHLKVSSVCQDIVELASRGREQTPKSLQCP